MRTTSRWFESSSSRTRSSLATGNCLPFRVLCLSLTASLLPLSYLNANVPPALSNVEDQLLRADEMFSWVIDDPERHNNSTLMTIDGLPEDAVLLENLDGTSTLVWIPGKKDIGEHKLVIYVANFDSPEVTREHPVRLTVAETAQYQRLRAERLAAKSAAAAEALAREKPGSVTIVTSAVQDDVDASARHETGLVVSSATGGARLIDRLMDTPHEPDTETGAVSDATEAIETQTVSESEGEVEAAIVAEAEPMVEPETVAQAEPMVEPETVAQAEPVIEPETVAEAEPVIEPETVIEPEQVNEPETVAESEQVNEPETVAESEQVIEPETVAESEQVIEPEIVAESELAIEPETVAEPELVIEPETVAESDQVIEPERIIESEQVIEPETVAEAEPVIEPETVAEPREVVELEKVAEPRHVIEPARVADTEALAEAEIVAKSSEDIESEPLTDPELPGTTEPVELAAGSGPDSTAATIPGVMPETGVQSGLPAVATSPLTVAEPKAVDAGNDAKKLDLAMRSTESTTTGTAAPQRPRPLNITLNIAKVFNLTSGRPFRKSFEFSATGDAPLSIKTLNMPTGSSITRIGKQAYVFRWLPLSNNEGKHTLIFQIMDENRKVVLTHRVKLQVAAPE